MEEIWKDVIGHEGYYQVSNLGRVKRVESKIKVKNFYRKVKENINYLHRGTYITVTLCSRNVKRTHTVHRLVAKAFILNPENKPQVNHLDSNKYNNNINNLEWCTCSENNYHAVHFGNKKAIGEDNVNAKLTDEIVLKSRENYFLNNITITKICVENNVAHSTMSDAINGKTWKHVKLYKQLNK